MTIATEWIIKTRAAMSRSAELKKVDAAVNTWATRGQGPGDANMKSVWTEFSAWKTAQAAEYMRIKAPADELQSALASVWNAKPGQLAGIGASGVRPVGWNLVPYVPATHGGALLAANQQVGAMTNAEISKVNEAMRRIQTAIDGARDAMLRVAKRKNFTRPMPPEEQTFTDFFGAYDEARLTRIVGNFQVLSMAFGNTPNFIDVRNRVQWSNTFGGCVRANLALKDAKGAMTLTGRVDMLIGRAFLGGGGYETTTDNTIATLVHEFAHGAINAVDVPDTDGAGNFRCTRVSDDPANPDFGNSTDPFGHQCGTEDADKLLARFKPEYAIVNADSYGQFTKKILIAARG